MRTLRINTTAFSEEDFYLETDLTINEITDVITPIVKEQRKGSDDYYHNFTLTKALMDAYPNNHINHFINITTISI